MLGLELDRIYVLPVVKKVDYDCPIRIILSQEVKLYHELIALLQCKLKISRLLHFIEMLL